MLSPLPLQLSEGQRNRIRRKQSTTAKILPLAALGAMLVICGIVIAVVMSRPPETHVSQATEDRDGGSASSAESPRVKPATQDNKPQVPANPVKPKPSTGPLRPLASNDSPEDTSPAKPAEAEKRGTPEELDKQLADAKTPDDYRAVAGEALRWAGMAMDDHQPDMAKKLILKRDSLRGSRTT